MRQVRVAAGILRDTGGRVLVSERLGDGAFAGLWEFPGGKIGVAETPGQALRRELAEELGIRVIAASNYMSLHHDYPNRSVDLQFFLVSDWSGEPEGCEGQAIRWVVPAEIDRSELLPANAPVIEALARG